jgi:hypothetical protein
MNNLPEPNMRGAEAHCVTCCAGVEPPSLQIVEQHKWDESQYPTFDMEGIFNAKHYGAKGTCACDVRPSDPL